MSGEKGNEPTSELEEGVSEDTVDDDVSVDFDETVGDLSAQFRVDELVAKLDKSDDVEHRRQIRRRLEELREQREYEKDLDSTFNFNLDEDL
jgi:hypothetical protein